MSISSVDNSTWARIMSQFSYQPTAVTSTTSSSSTGSSAAVSGISGVTASNNEGDTLQLSGMVPPPRPMDESSSNSTLSQALSAYEMFSKIDTDGSGSVTQSEFAAARPSDVTEEMAQNLYNSFDSDSSGSLTEAEYVAAVSNVPNQAPTMSMSTDSSDSESESSGLSVSKVFDALDTNKDGSVSLEELLAARPADVTEEMAQNLYNSLDSDGSGALSQSEFSSAMSMAPSVQNV